MTKLDAIPVAVEHTDQSAGAAGNAPAILHEIESMLETLAATGQANSIDLHHAPLSGGEVEYLKEVLGTGEVKVELDALGTTRLRETAVAGVWWITHYNAFNKVLGEFIEVTTCPEMLCTSAQDLAGGVKQLHSRIATQSQVTDPEEIAKKLNAMGLDSSALQPNANTSVKRSNNNAG